MSRVLVVLAAFLCGASAAWAWDVDLTDKPESVWQRYIGKLVMIRGSFYPRERFGPAVTSGHGLLYFAEWRGPIRLETREEILVEGRLRYHPPVHAATHSNGAPGYFYIPDRESAIRVSVQ